MTLPQLSLSLQFARLEDAPPHRAALARHQVRRWIRHALERDGEITVRIVDATEGQALNRDYRHKDYATNVLTFAYGETPLVADLVLCAPVVAQEAKEQGKTLQAHYAHLLVHGSVRLNAFSPERMQDPNVRALLAKVEVTADPELSRGYPNQRAAQIEIELNDGKKLAHFQPYRKGDPELPLTDDELNDKFRELATPVLGEAVARRLLDELWSLEKLKTVDLECAADKRFAAAG